MQTGSILAGFMTSMVVTLLAIPSIVTVARRKGLYGIVREKKKDPDKVPTLGGLAIFAGSLISLNLYIDAGAMPALPYIMAGALILFFIGLKDDILVTAPLWKLLGQIFVALIITIPGGLRIHDPGILLGFGPGGAACGILFTVLVIAAVINSFNLLDGIDGLASGMGMLSAILFGLVFYREGLQEWALTAAILCGSLAGFTWFNVFGRRNKILMGDTGSLLLGFILALLSVRFLDLENPGLWKWEIREPLAFTLAVLVVPIFDTLRIIFVRLFRGQSPLHPDRKHIHYRLVDTGFTHLQASAVLIGTDLFLVVLAMVLQNLGELTVILVLLAIPGLLSLIPGYYLKKRRRQEDR